MKGRMTILLDDEIITGVSDKIDISESYDEEGYIICCRPTHDEDFLSIFKNPENIKNFLNNTYFYSCISENQEHNLYELAKSKVGDLSLFLDCQTINIQGSFNDIKTFLENNPYLQEREITICGIEDLDYQLFTLLKKLFKKFPHVKFQIHGNYDSITLEEYNKTVSIIEEITNRIKKYGFSPFEAMIYAYDIVRDRLYVCENENERITISRDLSSVLLGEKIVCLGFSRIYNAILSRLNIKSQIIILKKENKQERHARILSYIEDPKYGIKGLYFFDPTFDCKKDQKNTFLNSYRYFAKTKSQIDYLSPYHFIYEKYEFLEEEKIEEFNAQTPEGTIDSYDLLRLFPLSRINLILSLLSYSDINPSSVHKDEIIEKLYCILDYISISIPCSSFIRALYNVRKIQYYENPNKYLFSIHVLTDILYNSKFDILDNPQDRFVCAINGNNTLSNRQSSLDYTTKYLLEDNSLLDMQRVILTRTLKTITEQQSKILKKQ